MARSMTKQVDEQASITTETTEEVKKPAAKKFSNTDEIPCISITPGQLFVEGKRSQDLYTFADMNDVQYIRYDDLVYCIRSHQPCVFKPRFIIQDKDFLAQHKEIEDLYVSLYSAADLKAILKLSPSQLRNKVKALPEGAKDALKVIASTMIDNGTFDSIQRIKALDEVLGTEMLFKISGN